MCEAYGIYDLSEISLFDPTPRHKYRTRPIGIEIFIYLHVKRNRDRNIDKEWDNVIGSKMLHASFTLICKKKKIILELS